MHGIWHAQRWTCKDMVNEIRLRSMTLQWSDSCYQR